jgi:hypothetical protein
VREFVAKNRTCKQKNEEVKKSKHDEIKKTYPCDPDPPPQKDF